MPAPSLGRRGAQALVHARLTLGGTTTAQVCSYYTYTYTSIYIYIYTHTYIYIKHTYQYSGKYTDIGSERLHVTHTAI